MSCLDATFTLTPRSPLFNVAPNRYALLNCFGADIFWTPPHDTSSLFSADRFYFYSATAANPGGNYATWNVRIKVPFIELVADLSSFGAGKSLALIFGFEAVGTNGRVLIDTNAGLVKDQTLAMTDDQFLLEIESLDNPFGLFFIHAGGEWFFNGLSGYVV